MNSIAERLVEVRLNKGLSKSKVAKALAISSQLYGKYETGNIKPKMEFYRKYETLFSINLLDGEDISFCQKCLEKERTIAALNIAIESMQSNIKTMQLMMSNGN